MSHTAFKRWIATWWVCAALIIYFGYQIKVNTAGSGTKIGTATIYASTNPCLTYDVNFATGLTIVTATASSDITVSYY